MTAWVFRDDESGKEVLVSIYLTEREEYGRKELVPEVGCVALRPAEGGSWGPPLKEVGER